MLPRQNVMPEKGIVQVNPYGGKTDNQINYRQPPYANYIIEVGDAKNLGILAKAAPIVIYKRFNMADWSTRNELFGMPLREIRYDPNMPHSKTQAEQAVREMGSAGYIVLPEGAQLVLHTIAVGLTF